MFGIPISLVFAFCFFYLFVHYQGIYISKFKFKGASSKVLITVCIYRIFGLLFGLIFLIFLGFRITWYAPIVLLAVPLSIGFILDVAFRFDKLDTYFCCLGMIVIPLDAAYMAYQIFLGSLNV
jgi:hypothetical protein